MKMRSVRVAASAVSLASCAGLAQAQAFFQNFDDFAALAGQGWFFRNNSDLPPAGDIGWEQGAGAPAWFDAHSGAPNSYALSNYASTTGNGATGFTISTWMLTPAVTLSNGDGLTFWSRSAGNGYADRLQVRLSTAGASTNVGTASGDTGDFQTLLLDINPTLLAAGYPNTWTQYSVSVSGLAGTPTGRFGFRYYVTDGGPLGNNSNGVGIDDMNYVPAGTPTGACCNTDGTCTPAASSIGCAAAGGQYQGNGSVCGGSCPQAGACCLATGLCAAVTQFGCTAQGGTFSGAGSTCASVTCPGAFKEGATDAGNLPGTAAVTTGSGSLRAISGTLATTTDIDVYKFSVCNSAAFSATTTGTGTGIDTELWIFDSAGLGVVANDDDPAGGATSYISNANIPGNGTYYIAVGSFDIRPESAGGEIWTPPLNATAEVTPDGAGASQPVSLWTDTGSTGSYGLLLTGSCFAAAGGSTCYANCDSSTQVPFLNVQDFTCFLNKFSAGTAYANCDNSTQPPVLNVQDFTCFLQKFSAGCSAP